MLNKKNFNLTQKFYPIYFHYDIFINKKQIKVALQ